MFQKRNESMSSRKDKKHLKPFRFGVPLDQLPCTYLSDFGNVAVFLVEAGEIIRCHVDIEGLFRKSADLSRHEELKLQAERGEGLGELDVHEVTCLVKTFLRLLPEPLLPCLFHDPFLSSMELSDHQRREAVQDLCFALPAPHLSCLRYFMNLLAYIASHVDKNRMNARNLAVVLTPSLIRLKARTKLMSPEELRVLPKQTALVEHLICHADGIGCMSSQLYCQSIKMSEELLQKKLGRKKKQKGKLGTNLEERLRAARAALTVVATLHFRPNTSTTISDTILVDGPHGQIVTASSLPGNAHVNSEANVFGHSEVKREAGSSEAPQTLFPTKTYCEKRRHTCTKRKRKRDRCHKALSEKSNCKAMLVPLIHSWSSAIPVISSSTNGDLDQRSCSSGDSSWSEEDCMYSHTDEEEEKTQTEIVAKNGGQFLDDSSLQAKNLDNLNDTEIHSLSESCNTSDCLSKDRNLNTEKHKGECGTSVSSETNTNLKQESLESNKTNEIAVDFNQYTFPDQQYSKENMNQFAGDTNQEVAVHKILEHLSESKVQQSGSVSDEKEFEKLLESQPSIQDKKTPSPYNANTENATRRANHMSSTYCPLTENTNKTYIKTVQEDQLLHSYEQCEKDRCGTGTQNQHSQNMDAQLFFANNLLFTCPQQHESVDSHTQVLPTILRTRQAGKLKRRLLQSARRHKAMEEKQQKAESTGGSKFSKHNWTENQIYVFGNVSDAENSTPLLAVGKELSPCESKKSMSVLRENDQSKSSLPLKPSYHLIHSPNTQCKFKCRMENAKWSHFEKVQQDSHYLKLNQQQIFSFGMDNMPPHLFDHIEHERPADIKKRQEELTVGMQKSPFSHLKAPPKNAPVCGPNQPYKLLNDSRSLNLPFDHCFSEEHKPDILQWHSHGTERLHNHHPHLQNDSVVECCNCCTGHSAGLEHPSGQNLLYQRLSDLRNQQGRISHHYHSDYCTGINLSKVSPLTERQPQYMDNYLQLGNETVPNCSSFRRFSYGFDSLQPQHYGTNLVSKYAFVEEGNNYTADLAHAEKGFDRHHSRTVPKELSEEDNQRGFLTSHYPDKLVCPSLCSHTMVQKNLYKTFLAEEKHVQNENDPCGENYGCGWTVRNGSSVYNSLEENKWLNYRETGLQDKPPCQTLISSTWIKERSRNEWELQTKDHVEMQTILHPESNACQSMHPGKWNQQSNCFQMQEIKRNEKEWTRDDFNRAQKIRHLCDESNQNSFSEFKCDHKENFQMDSCSEVNNTCDQVQAWKDNNASSEDARVYRCLQSKQYQADEGIVKPIKADSENNSMWNQTLSCNKEDNRKQAETCCGFAYPFLSSGGSQITQFSPKASGSTRTVNDCDDMSRNVHSHTTSNQLESDTLGFNECSPPHVHEQTHIQWSSDYSGVNPDFCQMHGKAILFPNSVQQFSLRPQTSQVCNNGSHKMCETKKKVHNTESVTFANKGLYECLENQNTQSKLQAVEYEVNKNQQDFEAKTISPSHLGDGQADRKHTSLNPRMVDMSNSSRKHRRKSPGTVKKAYNINTITPEQETAEEEMIENLKECLEMMSIQEDSQEEDNHKTNPSNQPERENVMVNCGIKIPPVCHANNVNNFQTEKTKISQILQDPTLISETVVTPLGKSTPQNTNGSNKNSSNTASNFHWHKPPTCDCLFGKCTEGD